MARWFTLVSIVLATTLCSGATTWTGNASTNWFSNANWTNGRPNQNDDVTLPAGRPRYPVLTRNARCRDLILQGASSINVNGHRLSVHDDLTLATPGALIGPGQLRFDRGNFLNFAIIASPFMFNGDVICNKSQFSFLLYCADTTCNGMRIRRGYCGLSDNNRTQTIRESLSVDADATLDAEDGTIDIGGNVLIDGTFLDQDNTGGDTLVDGNWTNNATYSATTQRVVFDGGGVSTITTNGTNDFGTLVVTNGTQLFPATDVHTQDDVIVDSGSLEIDPGLTLQIDDDATVRGLLSIGPGATLELGGNTTLLVESGGVFQAIGDPPVVGNLALITSSAPPARYGFTVLAGGRLRVAHSYFRYMNATGIQVVDNSTVQALDRLESTIFDNGAPNGRFLRVVGNDDSVSLPSLQFFDTTGGMLHNVETVFATAPMVIDPYDDDTHGSGFGGPASENDNGGGTVNPGSIQWGTLTPVVITSATATRSTVGTTIEWITEAEWKIVGFEVERVAEASGVARPLVGRPVAAEGQPGSRTHYVVVDAGSPNPSTVYALWTIDTRGRRHLARKILATGTFNDVAKERDSATPRGTRSALSAASATTSATIAPTPSTTGIVEIRVDRAGLHRVQSSDLVDAGLPDRSPSNQVRLFRDGVAWPAEIHDGGDGTLDDEDSVTFVAPIFESLESKVDVFTLSASASSGTPAPPAAFDGTPTGSSFSTTGSTNVNWESNSIYVASLESGQNRDHYFGATLVSGGTHAIELDIPHAISTDHGQLAVALEAFTDAPLSTRDHVITVRFDGVELETIAIDGRGARQIEIEVPGPLLTGGVHLIELQSIDESGPLSLVFIDRIDLSYTRMLLATNDAIRSDAVGGQSLELGGFADSDIAVFLGSQERPPTRVENVVIRPARDGTWTARLQIPPTLETATCVAASSGGVLPVLSASPAATPVATPIDAVDLVIIAPGAWIGILAPLVERRESEGWSVEVVPWESVRSCFDGGRNTSLALDRFLSHTHREWPSPAPRFALLVGDATFDPRENLGPSDRHVIPTRLIETAAFQCASDLPFSDVDGDGRADLAIGRLPVANSQECEAVVAKLATQAVRPGSHVALVSGPDPRFTAFSQFLGTSLASSDVTHVPGPENDDISTAWGDSDWIIYSGHGSRQQWSDESQLSTDTVLDDAYPLGELGHLPLVASFNCLSAYFIHPETPSLAEALVTVADRGAIGYFGPTGVTSHLEQQQFAQEMFRVMNSPHATTLGGAIIEAQQAYPDSEVTRTWVLLGDPTTPIPR